METLVLMTTVYFFIFALRYLVLSFSGFGLISLLPSHRKIQEDRQVTREQKIRELKHSLIASIPSSIIISFVVYLGYLGLNKVYFDISQYGILWFFGQILLLMVLTDIWFYFVHRAMHSKKLFRHTHKLHHLSTDPTPFATNSVHALEAVMDLGFIVIASFFIPLHPIALFITLSIAFIWSTIGHLGYEILPKNLYFIGKYLNLPTYHNHHHKTFKYNFGYYTTILDRCFGTLHPDSDKTLREKSSYQIL
jgi:sterol desaturase/sphingolipid hydroxylase (fatty acid hydroxylase superfamily)